MLQQLSLVFIRSRNITAPGRPRHLKDIAPEDRESWIPATAVQLTPKNGSTTKNRKNRVPEGIKPSESFGLRRMLQSSPFWTSGHSSARLLERSVVIPQWHTHILVLHEHQMCLAGKLPTRCLNSGLFRNRSILPRLCNFRPVQFRLSSVSCTVWL